VKESSVLPHDWKIRHIVPIFKKEAKLTQYYRRVCLISVIIKLLESIVKDTLYYWEINMDSSHAGHAVLSL